jgi:glutaredoxin-like protein NrdH
MTIIYTKSNCIQCDASKALMEDNGKQFQEISLEENPHELNRLKALGYMSAPIIETETDTWAGFNYEKILALP